ncbi:glutaredoxin-like protein DUF836 [Flavimobilis soli]|jgi:hypothetical protein|uniref:Glutaredoxin-like protein DUF836 n=1 Tax=Flavimobilis soli TaxID=442709 RepID=A0A2A9EC86_9MICO|nr:glutaredoxin family protein [Flavimobilis soli]PFG36514.1 glutaredoxin-like protein DUF836 [Flavimobilis soli]
MEPVTTSSAGAAPRVELLVRASCHLCEDAREVVAAVCAELGERWVEQDVDADPALVATYSDYVPVVLVDGVQQAFWRVDERRLRRALGRPSGAAR